MKINHTALGISPGLEQANFVFGNLAKSSGVGLNLVKELSQVESIAQQHLDFIHKLYFEQSYLGEYFEEIYLGAVVGESPVGSRARGPSMVELLAEQIERWITEDQLGLVLRLHTGTATKAQSKYLSLNNAQPDVLNSKDQGLAHAYALWSFGYSETVNVVKSKVFKKYEAIGYADMSASIADQYLDKYKNDTIASFSATKFTNHAIEKERQHLLNLANINQSGKLDLLVCRERILEMLELQSSSKTLLVESRVARISSDIDIGDTVDRAGLDFLKQPSKLAGSDGVAVMERPISAAGSAEPVTKESSDIKEGGSNDFFTSPQFTASDNVTPAAEIEKTWREPNARYRLRLEAWGFPIVLVVAIVSAVYFIRQLGG